MSIAKETISSIPPSYVPELLSVEDATKALKISRSTFYELVRVGALTPVKLRRRTMIVAAELAAYIRALPRGATQ